METILIDEREIVDKYAEKADICNARLIEALRKREKEAGINASYLGGIMPVMWREGMSLEMCINNLFAAYSCNFAESIFFQVDNIAKMRTIEMI